MDRGNHHSLQYIVSRALCQMILRMIYCLLFILKWPSKTNYQKLLYIGYFLQFCTQENPRSRYLPILSSVGGFLLLSTQLFSSSVLSCWRKAEIWSLSSCKHINPVSLLLLTRKIYYVPCPYLQIPQKRAEENPTIRIMRDIVHNSIKN